MREHLHRTGLRSRLGIESEDKFETEEGKPIADYSILFRELFCAAAAELADDMKTPIEKVGIMYDEIIHTGKKLTIGSKDPELASQDALGRGQLLFLIRTVDKAESQQLQSAGYRFAATENVIDVISGILQVRRDEFSLQLHSMREFASEAPILEPGCHLAFFAARASMANGFDILVRKDARNQLPTMQLPFDTWETWQTEYLRTMDTQTVAVCMQQLHKASRAAATSAKERKFAAEVLHTLEALKDEIEDSFFSDATLVANPIEAPCRGRAENSPPGMATLIVFKLIIPIQSGATCKKLDFTPLTFFKMQQHIYKNSRDHDVFARRAYREFAPLLNLSGRPSVGTGRGKEQHMLAAERRSLASVNPKSPGGRSMRGFFRRGSRPEPGMKGDNSSERSLVDIYSEDQGLGGIMVSQEVSVDVANRPASHVNYDDKTPAGIELAELKKGPKTGVESMVSKEEETPSYVDELFKATIQTRTVN